MGSLPATVSSVQLTRIGPRIPGQQAVIVPDGCVDILWSPGLEPWVAGPDTRPVPITLRAPTELVRLQLRTGWAGAALDVGINELVDQRVSLWDCWRSSGATRDIRTQLNHQDDLSCGASILVKALARRDTSSVHRGVVATVTKLDAGTKTSKLGTDLRTRAVRRAFVANVGYPPKTYELIRRFQRFMGYREADVPLAHLAVVLGYADQAHLTREVRRFSGRTPSALMS